jgi:hypothetical protein
MDMMKPMMRISTEQWQAKQASGLAVVVNDRAYIVTTHESTKEPVYQPVLVLDQTTTR